MITRRTSWQIALIVGVLGTLKHTALADPKPTAEDLYYEGQAAYGRADYAAAITKWQASYRLSGENLLLFNIAQAYRLSGDCARALAAYRRFVALEPAAAQRALAESFVREMEPQCGAARAAPAEPIAPTEDTGRSLRRAGLVTAGAGVAAIAIGLAFGRRASSLGDEVTRACVVSCDWAILMGKDAAGRRDAAIGYVLDVVGLAALVGGAATYHLGRRRGALTVVPRSRAEGAVLLWGGRW